MHALRDASDSRGAVETAGDQMHLRIPRIPKGKAANSKAAKGNLIFFFLLHLVVRMKFFCMVAHLLHTLKAFIAFFAHV